MSDLWNRIGDLEAALERATAIHCVHCGQPLGKEGGPLDGAQWRGFEHCHLTNGPHWMPAVGPRFEILHEARIVLGLKEERKA